MDSIILVNGEPGGGGPLGRKPDMHRAQYGAIALSSVKSARNTKRFLGRERGDGTRKWLIR